MRCIIHLIFHEEQTVFCSLTITVDIPNTNAEERGGERRKQVGSTNEESQVRGCCNFYLHQPGNSVGSPLNQMHWCLGNSSR